MKINLKDNVKHALKIIHAVGSVWMKQLRSQRFVVTVKTMTSAFQFVSPSHGPWPIYNGVMSIAESTLVATQGQILIPLFITYLLLHVGWNRFRLHDFSRPTRYHAKNLLNVGWLVRFVLELTIHSQYLFNFVIESLIIVLG